ncbi:MAG TPA: hypothetical protein VF407_25020 [Polyangiaceae bacterium]
MSPKRTAAVVSLFAVPALTCAFTACSKKPSLSFSLDVPSDVASNAAWYEIGAYAGTTCPPSSQFAGGLPSGYSARVSFAAHSKNPPGIDTLARGTYAFAGVVRQDDCGVIGVGCTVVDVSSADAVAIPVRSNDPPSGACSSGSVCQNAQCITSSNNDDVGANCSLDLVGAGPFADPYQPSGILTSAPAVVAVDDGFIVGYREYDPNLGEARLALLPIDGSGGPGPIHFETLETCADVDESDALGMAFSGENGLVVSARPNCAGSGGFDLFEIAKDTTIVPGGYGVVTSDIGTSNITLSTAHSVAPAPTGFYVAFAKDGQALLNVEQNADLGNTSSSFGGSPPTTAAYVTATDKLLAVLATAAQPSSGGTTMDAGKTDSGTGMGGVDAGSGPVFRLNVAAAGSDPAKLGTPIEMPGSWASFSAQGSRVFVASAGDDTLPVQFYGFDLSSLPDPAINDGFSVNTNGTVTFADIAFHNDEMFFAVESPGAISLVSYLHASTTPTFGREVVLGQNPRIPSLRGLRDGRVAVAASDTRVAVVWSTGRELGPDEAVGGYAIFACR